MSFTLTFYQFDERVSKCHFLMIWKLEKPETVQGQFFIATSWPSTITWSKWFPLFSFFKLNSKNSFNLFLGVEWTVWGVFCCFLQLEFWPKITPSTVCENKQPNENVLRWHLKVKSVENLFRGAARKRTIFDYDSRVLIVLIARCFYFHDCTIKMSPEHLKVLPLLSMKVIDLQPSLILSIDTVTNLERDLSQNTIRIIINVQPSAPRPWLSVIIFTRSFSPSLLLFTQLIF